jgi:hypothetical protein
MIVAWEFRHIPGAAAGHLVVSSGNVTDFDGIESDVRQLCSRFNVVSAGYDPWQSAQNVAATEGRGPANARVPGDNAELQSRYYRTRCRNASGAADARREPCPGVVSWERGRQNRPARELLSNEEQAGSEKRRSRCTMMAIGRAMAEDQEQAGLNGFLSNPIAF